MRWRLVRPHDSPMAGVCVLFDNAAELEADALAAAELVRPHVTRVADVCVLVEKAGEVAAEGAARLLRAAPLRCRLRTWRLVRPHLTP